MELIEGVNSRICTKCGTLKPFKKFYKDKKGKYGIRSKCKDCDLNRIKKNYQNNKEIKIEYQKEYQKEYYENNKDKINKKKKINKHKRRALKQNNGGSYTINQWNESLKYFNNKCAYSGKTMEQVSVEHIIPITKGGTSYIWNIIPCELSLNISKNNKDLLEWYKEQEFYSEERLNKIYEYIEYMKNKYELKEVI